MTVVVDYEALCHDLERRLERAEKESDFWEERCAALEEKIEAREEIWRRKIAAARAAVDALDDFDRAPAALSRAELAVRELREEVLWDWQDRDGAL